MGYHCSETVLDQPRSLCGERAGQNLGALWKMMHLLTLPIIHYAQVREVTLPIFRMNAAPTTPEKLNTIQAWMMSSF